MSNGGMEEQRTTYKTRTRTNRPKEDENKGRQIEHTDNKSNTAGKIGTEKETERKTTEDNETNGQNTERTEAANTGTEKMETQRLGQSPEMANQLAPKRGGKGNAKENR